VVGAVAASGDDGHKKNRTRKERRKQLAEYEGREGKLCVFGHPAGARCSRDRVHGSPTELSLSIISFDWPPRKSNPIFLRLKPFRNQGGSSGVPSISRQIGANKTGEDQAAMAKGTVTQPEALAQKTQGVSDWPVNAPPIWPPIFTHTERRRSWRPAISTDTDRTKLWRAR